MVNGRARISTSIRAHNSTQAVHVWKNIMLATNCSNPIPLRLHRYRQRPPVRCLLKSLRLRDSDTIACDQSLTASLARSACTRCHPGNPVDKSQGPLSRCGTLLHDTTVARRVLRREESFTKLSVGKRDGAGVAWILSRAWSEQAR